MPERNATDFLNLRLPLYAYTGPLWQGRRVLEIGCGDGGSADYLCSHGAKSVVAVDQNVARVERARIRHAQPRIEFRVITDPRHLAGLSERFDVILVPDGQAVLEAPGLIGGLRGLLADGGHLVVAVPAVDRRGRAAKEGVGYYDLADALATEFPLVRMLGQTPFLGFGLVEFDGGADALRVDVSLLQGGTEPPSHYIAVAGATPPAVLGYALVQIPFAPAEAAVLGGTSSQAGEGAASAVDQALINDLSAEIEQLTKQLVAARSQDRTAGLDSAERRLDEVERRARTRMDDAESRLNDLRVKLDDAMGRAESAVRVSRVQGEEIEELRGRLRRATEDRATTDADMDKLRRALSQADESVLTLTRRTAEGMAVVAEKMVAGFGGGNAHPAGVAGVGVVTSPEAEARVSRAEEASARDRAEAASLGERIRAADEQIRTLKLKVAGVPERDDRIARLEGDKQDLLWRVTELEEKLRNAERDLVDRRPDSDEAAVARGARDRAIEELYRGAAAHVNEVGQLQASVAEQAALVAELEDAVRIAEARSGAADKEAATLRRNAKELEEADRARRGRLAELEGKLLRLEREKAQIASSSSENSTPHSAATDSAVESALLAELSFRLQAAEQRAVTAEQRVVAAEERAATVARAATSASNGTHANAVPAAELASAVEHIEERLREEMRTLTVIEETLARARAEAASVARPVDPKVNVDVRADLDRVLAAKDSQLADGRLELARLRRDSEARQAQLEREITELRSRANPVGDPVSSYDEDQSAQLILMHATLANIRRRSARLRDELEGFRRRLDTLPPGALSSMLEEIGEDLAEFAK